MAKKWVAVAVVVVVIGGFFYITQETNYISGVQVYNPGFDVDVNIDSNCAQGNLDTCDGSFTVTNTGGATANNVEVEISGLVDTIGEQRIFDLGSLTEGESKSRSFNLTTLDTNKGDYQVTFQVTCNEGISETKSYTVHVSGLV